MRAACAILSFMITPCARFAASPAKAKIMTAPERIPGPSLFLRAVKWLVYKVQGRVPKKNSCQNFFLALTRREAEILFELMHHGLYLPHTYGWYLPSVQQKLEKLLEKK